jgi:hypothetical protein
MERMKTHEMGLIALLIVGVSLCSTMHQSLAGDAQDAKLPPAILQDLITNSDVIVIGRLQIDGTLDGHEGSIKITEVLRGKCKAEMVPFISAPINLVQEVERIWFLQRQAEPSKNYYLLSHGETSSAAVTDRQAVVDLIAKTKKRT